MNIRITDKNGKEQQVAGDKLLLAVGRGPLTKEIGLEEVGVKADERGYILVNGTMQTNVPTVYSIGDCVPTPWLAHVAAGKLKKRTTPWPASCSPIPRSGPSISCWSIWAATTWAGSPATVLSNSAT